MVLGAQAQGEMASSSAPPTAPDMDKILDEKVSECCGSGAAYCASAVAPVMFELAIDVPAPKLAPLLCGDGTAWSLQSARPPPALRYGPAPPGRLANMQLDVTAQPPRASVAGTEMAAAEQQALWRQAQVWLCGGHEGGDAARACPQNHQGEHCLLEPNAGPQHF